MSTPTCPHCGEMNEDWKIADDDGMIEDTTDEYANYQLECQNCGWMEESIEA